MKILRLQAENVKKLKVVEITPAGDLIQVTGKNGSGKTSVLDSIMWALGGKDKIQSVPIRKGADKAKIVLDLGKFTVERRFTASGSTITVKNADGATYPSPQAMLDDLLSSLSFDPLAFARKDPREQYRELKRIANIDLDFDALDRQNKTDFDTRRDKNRQVKELKARAEGFTFTKQPPSAIVDVAELVSKMQEAERHNAEIGRRAERRQEAAASLGKDKAALADMEAKYPGQIERLNAVLESEIARLRNEHAATVANLDSAIGGLRSVVQELESKIMRAEPLPSKVDTAAIAAQVQDAQILNREFERRQEQAAIQKQAQERQVESDALTKAMEAREEQKRKAMESAVMPVPGLSLGDGGVIFNGIPFDQASDAEQLRVSVAIAMAGNPTLRVIRIRDGSLLDENGLNVIAEMAKEKDYQVWLEKVDSSGKIGIVMEDGMVAADHQKEVQLQGLLPE